MASVLCLENSRGAKLCFGLGFQRKVSESIYQSINLSISEVAERRHEVSAFQHLPSLQDFLSVAFLPWTKVRGYHRPSLRN